MSRADYGDAGRVQRLTQPISIQCDRWRVNFIQLGGVCVGTAMPYRVLRHGKGVWAVATVPACLAFNSSVHHSASRESRPSRLAALMAKRPKADGAWIGGTYSSPSKSSLVNTTQ